MALNQEIIDITEAIKQTVSAEQIYLFGSHAYGKPDKNSDFDFFLVMPDDGISPKEAANKVRRVLAHMKRQTPVDILSNYRSRFDELAQFPTLERKIKREGVLLYASK